MCDCVRGGWRWGACGWVSEVVGEVGGRGGWGVTGVIMGSIEYLKPLSLYLDDEQLQRYLATSTNP